MSNHSYSSLSVAKSFCELSDWNLTNLKLQKLCYLAHMTYMGFNQGKHFIKSPFEAWKYGPISVELYNRLRAYGDKPVLKVFKHDEEVCESHAEHISNIFEVFGNMDSWRLVEITHRYGGAWDKTYDPSIKHNIISDDKIINEFKLYSN